MTVRILAKCSLPRGRWIGHIWRVGGGVGGAGEVVGGFQEGAGHRLTVNWQVLPPMNGKIIMQSPPDSIKRQQFKLLLFYLLLPFFILGCAFLITWMLNKEQNGRGITAENAAKIINGMTREEAVQILGCEPGWYFGPDHKGGQVFYQRSHRPTPVLWMSSTNGITVVAYFENNVVSSCEFLRSRPNNDPKPKDWPVEFSRIP